MTSILKLKLTHGFLSSLGLQAVGQCGGNEPRTDMFKISHVDGATGRTEAVRYERRARAGGVKTA